MHRREFCRRAGAVAAAGAVGAGAGTASASGSTIPEASTVGHLDVEWHWDVWNGGAYRAELTGSHSEYDYDTNGSIPWNADEVTVVVHGWGNDASEARDMFSTTTDRLRSAGYDGEVVGFSYDADVEFWKLWEVGKWWAHYDVAKRNGKKLANFLTDLLDGNGDATVNLVGHSLGAQPILNALVELDRTGDAVDAVSLLGGAAEDDAVAAGAEYGPAIENNCETLSNYYKTDDQILDKAYGIAEFDDAVGEQGCEGTTPANYSDHDVTHEVDTHFDHYSDAGMMQQVVDDWNGDSGDDSGDDSSGSSWWDWSFDLDFSW